MNEEQMYELLADQVLLMAKRSEEADNKDLVKMTICMVRVLESHFVCKEKEKRALEKQLLLLSKRSQEADCEDLSSLSYAMGLIVRRLAKSYFNHCGIEFLKLGVH